jgi:hypothetical protein
MPSSTPSVADRPTGISCRLEGLHSQSIRLEYEKCPPDGRRLHPAALRLRAAGPGVRGEGGAGPGRADRSVGDGGAQAGPGECQVPLAGYPVRAGRRSPFGMAPPEGPHPSFPQGDCPRLRTRRAEGGNKHLSRRYGRRRSGQLGGGDPPQGDRRLGRRAARDGALRRREARAFGDRPEPREARDAQGDAQRL